MTFSINSSSPVDRLGSIGFGNLALGCRLGRLQRGAAVGSHGAAGVLCPEIEDKRGPSISSWTVWISEGKDQGDDRGSWDLKQTALI